MTESTSAYDFLSSALPRAITAPPNATTATTTTTHNTTTTQQPIPSPIHTHGSIPRDIFKISITPTLTPEKSSRFLLPRSFSFKRANATNNIFMFVSKKTTQVSVLTDD